MTKAELAEYRRLTNEHDAARREYERLQRRREEIASRKVRNEEMRDRFLLRMDVEIAEAHERMVSAEILLEGAQR